MESFSWGQILFTVVAAAALDWVKSAFNRKHIKRSSSFFSYWM